MKPPHVAYPRPGRLGPDPEPLGTERYDRLMKRVRARSSPQREPLFHPMAKPGARRSVGAVNGHGASEGMRKMNVVIAGGGVAALETVIALRDLAGDRVRLTLVAPDDEFVYQPASVTEPFARGSAARLSLQRFARDFDVALVRDGLASVVPSARKAWLAGGAVLDYDKLVVATGALRENPFGHATVFRGQEDTEALHGLIQDMEQGYVRRIVFVVPPATAWSLPAYELALMTAARAREMCVDVELSVVTSEARPLAIFGPTAAQEVEELLAAAGVAVHPGASAEVPRKSKVVIHPGDAELSCDRVISLARLRGTAVRGLPADHGGFVPTDNHGRVGGVDDVYAAGDGTNFPVKQGGIACQQADAVAEVIAKAAGAPIEPRSFRPVLRGQLLTGRRPRFMRHNLSGQAPDVSRSGSGVLWWPPSKIAGHYLAPYLHALDTRAYDERARREELELREYEVLT